MSKSIIKTYTNKKGKSHEAHFSPSGKYLGSVSKKGDKPLLLTYAKQVLMFNIPKYQDKPAIIERCDDDTPKKEWYFDTGVFRNIVEFCSVPAKKTDKFYNTSYLGHLAFSMRLFKRVVVGRTAQFIKLQDKNGRIYKRKIQFRDGVEYVEDLNIRFSAHDDFNTLWSSKAEMEKAWKSAHKLDLMNS
jgi:hypothetical protein